MRNLKDSLNEMGDERFPALADVWGVKLTNLKPKEQVKAIQEALQDEEKIQSVWDKLDDSERGAMQLLASSDGSMTTLKFELMFGKIRKMGKGAVKRDKPHKQPESVAESLFYKGFVSEGFHQTDTGATGVIYIPSDWISQLPLHQTSYDNLDSEDFEPVEYDALPILEAVENIQQADTSLVDDLTTLLAYLQVNETQVEGNNFSDDDRHRLLQFMLTDGDIRLAFLLGVGASADLLTTSDGRAFPKRAEARRWLTANRSEQVKMLAEAWRASPHYRDLWHVPGLFPDDSGWAYDPVVGRQTILSMLGEFAPEEGWLPIDEFIDMVQDVEPDFQRPGSDYDSWYIRNESGDYLHGFESWDAVEGALLEFYLMGPLHWLGLVDTADDAVRLTAYGRAFFEMGEWVTVPDDTDPIVVNTDGTIQVSRRVNRFDRFQLARFTSWLNAGNAYTYKIDANGIQRGQEQGITDEHITAFLNRHLDNKPIPHTITQLLQTWKSGAKAEVTFERVMLLRTTSPELMNRIYDSPQLRRFLGGRLGPMACIIRAEQSQELQDALGEVGIQVEVYK